MKEDQMEPTCTESYRGWEIKVFSRGDGTFTAVYENEHLRDELPDESRPTHINDCLKKARRAIDLHDSFDPQFRSAAFQNVEPPSFDKWLIGEESD